MPPEEPTPPILPDPGVGDRSLTNGELFLLWAGILLPGLTSPFFLIGWFLIGYGEPELYRLWLIVVPMVWLLLILGCCYLCGWIHAIKRGTEGRKQRALKAGGLFLLGQLVVTPTLGFGCCLLVTQITSM